MTSLENDEILKGLNPRQIEAVRHVGGPLLIVAGAGSGKTRVITHRIAYLLRHAGVPPREILALTFTNKAAEEMRERTTALVGDEARGVMLKTFHAFCLWVLRVEGELLGYRPGFSFYDEDDALAVMRAVMREQNISSLAVSADKMRDILSRAKNLDASPESLVSPAEPFFPFLPVIQEQYEKKLLEQNALDFDNLILKTVALLEEFPEARDKYHARFRHILVDEYQDTNHTQYRLLRLLAGPDTDVTVVGDTDQSIYGWRGADFTNLFSFERDFPNVRAVFLEQNYRSAQNVLDAANALIRNNPGYTGKVLWSELGEGERVS